MKESIASTSSSPAGAAMIHQSPSSDSDPETALAKHHDDGDQKAVESRRKQKEKSTLMKDENVGTQSEADDRRQEVATEDNGRERLKRHRGEVAGQVWIPDIWGQEALLKDWIDCSAFDASVVNASIMSARAALAEEGSRANSTRLRIENSC